MSAADGTCASAIIVLLQRVQCVSTVIICLLSHVLHAQAGYVLCGSYNMS